MQIFNIASGAIGTNTYLVYDDEGNKEGFLVDPGAYNRVVSDKIRELGINLKYIMLTHGHADHIMGVLEFKEDFPGAQIVAHKLEKKMLGDMNFNMSAQFGHPTEFDADKYVDEGDVLEFGRNGDSKINIEFFFTPGHSPGGMCIYIPAENTLFSGDTLFRASIGRTDFPGCSFEALETSIHEKLWPLPDDTAVYPGHMDSTNIGFEKNHNPFV